MMRRFRITLIYPPEVFNLYGMLKRYEITVEAEDVDKAYRLATTIASNVIAEPAIQHFWKSGACLNEGVKSLPCVPISAEIDEIPDDTKIVTPVDFVWQRED